MIAVGYGSGIPSISERRGGRSTIIMREVNIVFNIGNRGGTIDVDGDVDDA